VVPGYPIKEVYGDYQHFVQNKRKEWSDLCGTDRHVCRPDDPESSVVRRGINSALNDFVDHYAKPRANPGQGAPTFDVSASLQVCPLNASEDSPLDEPGPRFTAPSFEELAPNTLRIDLDGEQSTTSRAVPNLHALAADPVANQVSNSSRCPSGAGPAGPGVATYESEPLDRTYTMIGPTHVTVPYEASGSELQLNARLYDVPPEGNPAMVDRGFRTLTEQNGSAEMHLMGNGWRFERGHRVRIELAQDDDPFLKASTIPSRMALDDVTLRIPVREETAPEVPIAEGGGDGGGPDDRDPGRPDGADTAPAATGELPFTGLALGPLFALGFLLVALGATLRAAAPVRRSSNPLKASSGSVDTAPDRS
jgi:hypothetical protein